MLEDIKTYIEEIEIILKEADSYKALKKQFLSDIKTLNQRYEKGEFSYGKYKRLKEKLLGGKTKKENVEYFNAYILSLVRKLEYLNTQIFSVVYQHDTSQAAATPKKATVAREIAAPTKKSAALQKGIAITKGERPLVNVGEVGVESVAPSDAPKQGEKAPKGRPLDIGGEEVEQEAEVVLGKEKARSSTSFPEDIAEVSAAEGGGYATDDSKAPLPRPRKKHILPRPRKKGFFGVLKTAFGKDKGFFEKEEEGVEFRGIFNLGFLRDFFKRVREKEEYIGGKTSIEKSILDFKGVAPVDFEEEAKTNPNLLVKQATQLKELLKKRHLKVYNPSILGTLSNVLVREFSIYLINNFPEFFKNFYEQLRFANIKLLSNTYVNIMVFLSIISSLIFGGVSVLFSLAGANPLYLLLSKAFLFATLGVVFIVGIMVYYPSVKIKNRKKSINTNLPFAIDHMSSLVASGVSPATMFRLLSESREYGEMSLEIERISNYIDVFGYDLVTAVKSVAATTPALSLKEFFDGLISTIESGGSLKNYLSQKSKDAMLSYRLERQKYIESISTYSDIYTGALIAAPLFFVSALSLVSMLGGKIGGFEVETIIAFGTYLAIPVLNMVFLIFLELNQPEV